MRAKNPLDCFVNLGRLLPIRPGRVSGLRVGRAEPSGYLPADIVRRRRHEHGDDHVEPALPAGDAKRHGNAQAGAGCLIAERLAVAFVITAGERLRPVASDLENEQVAGLRGTERDLEVVPRDGPVRL